MGFGWDDRGADLCPVLVSDGLPGQVYALVQLLLAQEGREVWEMDIAVAHVVVCFTLQGAVELKVRGGGICAAVTMLGPGLSQVALP